MLLYIVAVRIRSKRILLRKAIDWTRAKEQVIRRSSGLGRLNPKRRVKERNIEPYNMEEYIVNRATFPVEK